MSRRRALVLLLIPLAEASCAFLGWRDKVVASWPAAPVQIDGSDAKWAGVDEVKEPQLVIRAMSDRENVYLRIAGDGDEGRALLTGAYRQDVTVWFLAPDGKSREWGVRLPFGSLDFPVGPLPKTDSLAIPAVEPLLATALGASPLPGDIRIRSGISGSKDPTFELSVPLSRLHPRAGSLPFDISSSEVRPEIRRAFSPKKTDRQRPPYEVAGNVSFPSPLRLRLRLLLARVL